MVFLNTVHGHSIDICCSAEGPRVEQVLAKIARLPTQLVVLLVLTEVKVKNQSFISDVPLKAFDTSRYQELRPISIAPMTHVFQFA